MPTTTGSSRKRKAAVSLPESNKRQRQLRSSKSLEHAATSLLDLPIEIIDNILSHVIDVPHHPVHSTFPSHTISDLFSSGIHRTNQYLRQRSVDYIARNTLWIHVEVRSRSAWRRWFACMEDVLPTLPPIYRSILPTNLAVVKISVGPPEDQVKTTRRFTPETSSLFFAFNYHSFAEVYSRVMESRRDSRHVHIDCSNLLPHIQRVAQIQILPIAELMRQWLDVTINDGSGEGDVALKRHARSKLTPALKADTIMNMVLDLDRHGRKLEATILCMYSGYSLWLQAQFDDDALSLDSWLNQSLKSEGSDWRSYPPGLERMRLIRTILYIESRALFGYLAGCEDYGAEFHRVHFNELKGISDVGGSLCRWLSQPEFTWFGMPDHEMASYFHGLSCLYEQLCSLEFDSSYIVGRMSPCGWNESDRLYRCQAIYCALRAWQLDRTNTTYAMVLNEYFEDTEDPMRYQEHILTSGTVSYTDTSGEPHVYLGKDIFWETPEHLKYLSRAQEVARLADVAYDDRRGDDLLLCKSGDANDEAMITVLTRLDHRAALEYCPAPWEKIGLDNDAVSAAELHSRHEVVKYWTEWTPM